MARPVLTTSPRTTGPCLRILEKTLDLCVSCKHGLFMFCRRLVLLCCDPHISSTPRESRCRTGCVGDCRCSSARNTGLVVMELCKNSSSSLALYCGPIMLRCFVFFAVLLTLSIGNSIGVPREMPTPKTSARFTGLTDPRFASKQTRLGTCQVATQFSNRVPKPRPSPICTLSRRLCPSSALHHDHPVVCVCSVPDLV